MKLPLQFAILLATVILVHPGCRAITGGAEKDEFEATREVQALQSGPSDVPKEPATMTEADALAPTVEADIEGFARTPAGRVGNAAAEGGVILGLAAAITGLVRMFQRRLVLLTFFVSLAALALGAASFLSSAT